MGQTFIPAEKLLVFLQKEQFESSSTEQTATDLIAQHEILADAVKKNCMTFEGFARYMMSQRNSICSFQHKAIYQDMTRPLCDYFISTSHNTYLIADQLVGQSHLWAYASALMRGCRCLEIDCWDGPEGDPIVYHGYTLTSKLLFKTVIYVIEKYAFMVSQYPLILSLENHCGPKQQVLMTHYLKQILGDKLLTKTVGNSPSKVLPSPEDLKCKILIKDKKATCLQDTGPHNKDGGQVPESTNTQTTGKMDDGGEKKPAQDDNVSAEPDSQTKNKKGGKVTVAMTLSDLVIYTKAEKFVSFQHSNENQKFYELNSLAESQAQKLLKKSAREFIHHTKRFITRIYPKGFRTASSNYNPQVFWNVGCQMVALNFQTPGIPMDLQDGRFQDNGGCGYVLKPQFLRDESIKYNPYDLSEEFVPVTLSIRDTEPLTDHETAGGHRAARTSYETAGGHRAAHQPRDRRRTQSRSPTTRPQEDTEPLTNHETAEGHRPAHTDYETTAGHRAAH
ncbi:1-phosphatidylinositol 4,5-bisphosphate phosphodiesterase zeta-1 [Discoglossus pictus]